LILLAMLVTEVIGLDLRSRPAGLPGYRTASSSSRGLGRRHGHAWSAWIGPASTSSSSPQGQSWLISELWCQHFSAGKRAAVTQSLRALPCRCLGG